MHERSVATQQTQHLGLVAILARPQKTRGLAAAHDCVGGRRRRRPSSFRPVAGNRRMHVHPAAFGAARAPVPGMLRPLVLGAVVGVADDDEKSEANRETLVVYKCGD